MVHKIIADISCDPGGSQFRQGGTPGNKRKHWLRGKSGNGCYRLSWRYESVSKTIILGWLNGEQTLRTKGDKQHDACEVFKRMLDEGNSPDGWQELIGQCLAAQHGFKNVEAMIEAMQRLLSSNTE